MSRGNGDTTVVSSSIALLQERFRELQRTREKRQEKELLKLFSESERIAPNTNFEPAGKMTCQPEINVFPPNRPPPRQDSLLTLGLNPHSKQADFRAMKTPTSLWPNAGGSSSRSFESSDVDTSLHL
ncbi:hypothetical protein Tsubulata_038179 [Turnera subulata]|uniref:Uncharacterized protein n=1 Tax=Turnera subulata TaxID=218843 RepID=A0A9Q0FS32_9ROSI|nr:hypothetical protein Tsubulata_038179 [Turnera subulata]